jgi:hypothetical protein
MAQNHCDDSYVHIGTTEVCVMLILGAPLHTNDDALSVKQLVYAHDYFVYINKDGRVEDIQDGR